MIRFDWLFFLFIVSLSILNFLSVLRCCYCRCYSNYTILLLLLFIFVNYYLKIYFQFTSRKKLQESSLLFLFISFLFSSFIVLFIYYARVSGKTPLFSPPLLFFCFVRFFWSCLSLQPTTVFDKKNTQCMRIVTSWHTLMHYSLSSTKTKQTSKRDVTVARILFIFSRKISFCSLYHISEKKQFFIHSFPPSLLLSLSHTTDDT